MLACSEASAPSTPPTNGEPADSRAGLACADVTASGTAPLGFIPSGLEGAGSLGGLPGPFTVAGITGTLHSYVTSGLPVANGANGDGATHIMLRHVFSSPEGGFHTDDRAVCAPNPDGPGTCQLSDQMDVGGGTGAFEKATGKWHNTGVLDFNIFLLTYSTEGRICAAGI
ncbi:MAG: hypothetical protein ACJ8AU_01565 [Gemmatimonadales bacterium]